MAVRKSVLYLLATLGVLAGCIAPQRGRDPALAQRLDAILHQLDETGAIFTARVVELPSRRELYAVNVDKPFIPASNMKLSVSAAGLDMFGPDHTFKTYLALHDADLWLIGSGDPGVGDERIAARYGGNTNTVLVQWTAALRSKGITRIKGDLYYFDGAFEAQRVHPTWHADDLVHWYAAPVSGLNFNDNCIDIEITPRADGTTVDYRVTPAASGIEIVNQCVSAQNQPGGDEDEPDVSRAADANVYTLTGRCRERTRLKSKPVVDPGAFFADALRTRLIGEGIVVEGKARSAGAFSGPLPPPAEQWVATHETRLSDILWRINKNSQNLFAECLCKLTGREFEARRGSALPGWERDVPGSWESGERAIRAFLRRHKIDDHRLVVADGSGLSEKNRVTARLMTDLLAAMHGHHHAKAFKESLSVAGQDGTLAGRMKDLVGHVFAKTGQISGVRALSGYIRKADGGWLCFSIIYNRIPGSVKPYEELQDEACRLLFSYGTGPTPPPESSRGEVRSLTAAAAAPAP